MNAREFFYITVQMRDAQKRYFKTRAQEDLRRARAYENEIDSEILRVKAIIKEQEEQQQHHQQD